MVKKLQSEEYGGYTITFERKGGMVFARASKITRQFIGAGRTKEQALNEAKNVIDVIKKTNKTVKCDINDLDKKDAYAVYTKGDRALLLLQDQYGDSPRDWDNLGIMACSHRRYDLGDEQLPTDEYNSWEEIRTYLIKERGAIPSSIAPLYLYDHSGLRIKIGSFAGLLPQGHAEFDSGQVGYIYTTKEKLKQMGTPNNPKKIKEILKGEVELYDQYLSGDIYFVETYRCKDGQWELEDSVGEFYGADIKTNGVEDNFGKGWREL